MVQAVSGIGWLGGTLLVVAIAGLLAAILGFLRLALWPPRHRGAYLQDPDAVPPGPDAFPPSRVGPGSTRIE